MNLRWAIAIGLFFASAQSVSDGVVMSVTSTTRGMAGPSSLHRVIYTQGNKQKVQHERLDTITDLDKNVVYLIDKPSRTYAELPLRNLGPATSGETTGLAVPLKPTARHALLSIIRVVNTRAAQVMP
jgi:hypothetical protein